MALQVRGGPWRAPRPSRGTGCDRRELVLGWMETLATLSRRRLARPVGSDLVGIVPETEIKAFWWLRQTVTLILFLFDGFWMG